MNEKQTHNNSEKETLVHLMNHYGDMVMRIAFTYVKEKPLAEDITQEVFIQCFQSLHTFEKRSSYRTWLYSITVNHCKDHVKSWSFKNLIPSEPMKIEKGMKEDIVSTQVLREEENEYLFQRVLELPVKLREVIIFHYYEELSIGEISELLNVKENTVKTRLHRGRNKLKKTVKGGMALE